MPHFLTLPVHEVKIDKSFVQNMISDEGDRSLVKMMVGLARSFSLKMVAEGVEDSKTLQALKSLGVDRVQGYYVAKPMPEDEFLTWAEYYITNLDPNNLP